MGTLQYIVIGVLIIAVVMIAFNRNKLGVKNTLLFSVLATILLGLTLMLGMQHQQTGQSEDELTDTEDEIAESEDEVGELALVEDDNVEVTVEDAESVNEETDTETDYMADVVEKSYIGIEMLEEIFPDEMEAEIWFDYNDPSYHVEINADWFSSFVFDVTFGRRPLDDWLELREMFEDTALTMNEHIEPVAVGFTVWETSQDLEVFISDGNEVTFDFITHNLED